MTLLKKQGFNKMGARTYIKLFFISFLVFAFVVPFGSELWGYGGHHIKFTVTSLLYCFVTYKALQSANYRKEQLSIILIISIFPLLISWLYIKDFQSGRMSFPSHLSHFYGIMCGYLSYNYSKIKIATIAVLIISSAWMTFYGYDYWLHYLNHGSFTSEIYKPAPDFAFGDDNGNIITKQSLKGKVVVLDFWSTSCGVCFRKFPLLEEKNKKYNQHKDVKFIAVNAILKRDTLNQAFNKIKQLKYRFPVAVASKLEVEKFGVYAFPAVIILDKGGNMIFRGELENVDDFIEKARLQ